MKDFIYISDRIKTHDGFEESMKACLYAAEKHGIVFGQNIEDRASLIKTARKYLPEHTVTEAVNIDCVMIKSAVTDLFGTPALTGKTMQEIETGLKKYARKINKFGFSCVTAHKALYSGGSSRTPTPGDRTGSDTGKTADATNATGSATPNRTDTATRTVDTLISFLPLLDDEYYPKKRILFDCSLLQTAHTGTTEVTLAAFEAFTRLYKDKYDIYMYTNRKGAEYHKLAEKYDNILYPDTIGEQVFHLGYAPNQLMSYYYQADMNRYCLKIVQLMHDIMMMRIKNHFPIDVRSNTDLGVRMSDGIAFVSKFSRDDFLAYYNDDGSIESKKLCIIYDAKAPPAGIKTDYELPFNEFYLVAGNAYKHKAIAETLEVIKDTDKNFIVIGGEEGELGSNIYSYKSGHLEEDFINLLYQRCKALIFPSLYEGFGLPTIMGAVNGKQVILYDNAVNRELEERYPGFRDKFMFFKRFEDIPALIGDCDKLLAAQTTGTQPGTTAQTTGTQPGTTAQPAATTNTTVPVYTDSWDRAAAELERFFTEILSDDVDSMKLNERLWMYKHIEDGFEDKLRESMREITDQFGSYKLRELIRFAVKEYIKHKYPKLFRRLKGEQEVQTDTDTQEL